MVTAAFFVATFRLAYRAHKNKPVTGGEGLIGLEGLAKSGIGPQGGTVVVHGEIWSAWADNQIGADEKVIVEAVNGLKIKVRRKG